MKKTIQLDEKTATASGYRALTIGYRLPQEQHMLDAVVADMRRGKIAHCLVKGRDGVAVWRSSGAANFDQVKPRRAVVATTKRGNKSSRKPTTKKGKRS